jgi:hypothetical protein
MRVIDDAQKRLLLGNLGEQAQDRQADQELIRCRPGAEPERDVKSFVLGLRQAIREVEEWSTQLLSRCERELHLSLDPDGPGDPKLGCSLDRILEERGLADARLAVDDQYPATRGAHAV